MAFFGNKMMVFEEGSSFDIEVTSTNSAYQINTGGASGVTWTATHSGGTIVAVGDNPVFNLSGVVGSTRITANVILSSCRILPHSLTSKVKIYAIDLSLAVSMVNSFTQINLSFLGSIRMPLVTDARVAFYLNFNLLEFPETDTSSLINIDRMFYATRINTFPLLNLNNVTVFTRAWDGCRLNAQSFENVLQALVNNGRLSKVTTIGKDTTPLTATATALLNTLTVTRGWTVTIQSY